jgi:hypothetical protein
MQETAQDFEKLFFIYGSLIFIAFQILCHTSKLLNFVKMTGPLKVGTVRHVTENDQDYLRKIPRVVVQKSALL